MRKTIWTSKPSSARDEPLVLPPGPLVKWNPKYAPTEDERRAFAGLLD